MFQSVRAPFDRGLYLLGIWLLAAGFLILGVRYLIT